MCRGGGRKRERERGGWTGKDEQRRAKMKGGEKIKIYRYIVRQG
jgi:hypothetical protein